MSGPWRKIENEEGYPYYLNELTNVKQWDHPKFVDIRQRIDDCNYVKYSVYRVALKFRVLQNALHMEEVPLSVIAEVFERHRLGANESSLCLESCDLEAVLSDVYFAANKKNHMNIDIDFATELMLNFLYNVYDKDRKGKIQVASTKIVLALLGNCTSIELYKFIFQLCADHNNCVTRLRLQSMLLKIVEITNFLHEDVSFGSHLINTSIENCFSNSPGLVGINESMFITWLEKGPKIFSWIPLLHRIKIAEPVMHSVTCTTCKTNPLMGLRYKCMKCSRYTQCQRCFFTGRTSHAHKLTHSMREYCTQSNDYGHTFIKKICGLLYCSQKINNSTVVETKPLCSDRNYLPKSYSKEILCDIEPLSSPQTQLQVIIRQLEMQNRELQQILLLGSHNDKDIRRYLEEHRIHVAAQIQKLKILKEYLKIPPNSPSKDTRMSQETVAVESTPMVQTINRPHMSVGMELFSPIQSITENDQRGNHVGTRPPNFNKDITQTSSVPYGIDDMSTWVGGQPTTSNDISALPEKRMFPRKSPVRELHNDLDDALAKLQQILANNFSLDESLGHIDNTNLKYAVSEVEGMLTSFIDSVETSRGSSVRSHRLKFDKESEIIEQCS
ncbi:dystrophin-related protein 2-like [Anoplophora glabripennis]|uniref:dystrophin-related protein 2-like n=1 Tax=Anoplophora glabripennis TaxID=217634 RepID=UPI0008736E30|nr:dystrophin-related protein 2-like [Anoplophora glabripennis]